MNRDLILYFVKYPEPGKVKTRLAKTVGDETAAKFYGHLAEHNFRILASLNPDGVKNVVVFDPPDKEVQIREWLPEANEYLPQNGNDLGARLTHAFRSAFEQGYERVIALGSDTLELKAELILGGFECLKDHDVVLGPAKDGGYYLIGLAQEHPLLFQDIPWSTSAVLESTIAKIKDEELSFYCIQKLEDLDEIKILTKER